LVVNCWSYHTPAAHQTASKTSPKAAATDPDRGIAQVDQAEAFGAYCPRLSPRRTDGYFMVLGQPGLS